MWIYLEDALGRQGTGEENREVLAQALSQNPTLKVASSADCYFSRFWKLVRPMIKVPADSRISHKGPPPGLQPVAFSRYLHMVLLSWLVFCSLGTPGPVSTQPLWGLKSQQMSFEETQHSADGRGLPGVPGRGRRRWRARAVVFRD